MINFNYQKLFKPTEFDYDKEVLSLTYLISLMIDDMDFKDVLLVAKTATNMSEFTGVSIQRLVETLYDADLDAFEPDEQMSLAAKVAYDTNKDKLDGACFVLTPADIVRLRINMSVLPPSRIIKRKHKEGSYILYFYNMLPLESFRAGEDE